MDPLSALGLAASVVQFIDFGAKIISHAKEIEKNGSSATVQHITAVTHDFIEINSTLKGQLLSVKTENLPLTKESQALLDLTNQTNEIAQELVQRLEEVTITVEKSRRSKNWEKVKVTMKTIWKKEGIDELARKLTEYRGQLILRVLLLFNSYYAVQGEKLDELAERNKEIVEVVSISLGTIQSRIEGYQEAGDLREENASLDAERRHAEVLTAILTTRGGESRAITADYPPELASHLLKESTDDAGKTTTRDKQCSTIYSNYSAPELEVTPFNGFTKQILDGLHYRCISDRRAAILPAHNKTFKWIYEDATTSVKRWDNLSSWLRNEVGCYWVNGKAGSGKSTLMKYIQEDTRTMECLAEWAGSSELIVGSFFFWYAGTPIQKSQMGLLRSLLFDVLRRRPELIPVLFPDVCRSILTKESPGRIDLSFVELKRAFTTFINLTSPGLKTCFIIDGIDEYDGDPNEICDLLSQATTSKSVKVLLSSRPIPACVQAFSNCSTLRLQDLTYGDIKLYVDDQLGRDPLMQRLERSQRGVTHQLFNSITSKAAGVLLWVVLVVKSLRKGLQDYDTISDLQQRLDELPPTLEALYAHMLKSMSPKHRRQGSKLLQLVLRSSKTHGNYPMTLLQLSFAEDENYSDLVDSQPGNDISADEEDWRCEAIEGRMRSRCCGLIEVQDSPLSLDATKDGKVVGFLHRTVVEFLETDSVWDQLVSLTAGAPFNADLALLRSCLLEIRAKTTLLGQQEDDSPAPYSMVRMLAYGKHMHNVANYFQDTYLSQLRNILGRSWHDPNLFNSAQAEMRAITAATNRRRDQLNLSWLESFFLFAAVQCPKKYLTTLLEFCCPPDDAMADQARRGLLAAYLLLQYMDPDLSCLQLAIAKSIHVCQAVPDTPIDLELSVRKYWNHRWRDLPIGGGTMCLWDYALHVAYSRTRDTDLHDSILSIVLSMLQSGANTDRAIVAASDLHSAGSAGCLEVSAFAVLHPLMNKIWSARNGSTSASSSEDILSEKACYIEHLMKSKNAKMWTQIHEPLPTRSPKKPKKQAKRMHSIQKKANSPPRTAEIEQPKTMPAKDRTYFNPGSAPSPWAQCRLQKLDVHSGQEAAKLEIPKQVKDIQFQNRWNITARDNRVNLLDREEQELAEKLSRPLNGKEQLLALKEMSRLPYQRQEQILECSKVFRQWRETASAVSS